MIIVVKLSELQQRIYEFISQEGITSTVVLRLKFRTTQLTIDRLMDKLLSANLVIRPSKGIVINREWIEKNPEHAHWIENELLFQLTEKKGKLK